jgi:hypothetical protein
MPAIAAPVTTPAATPAVSLPNGNTSADSQTSITPNQYALAPGESIAAYNTRIAGLRSASGMATPSTDANGAPTDVTSAEDQVAQSLGYKSFADATSQLTAPPTQSESDLYNSAYSAAGLDQLQNTITGRQNDLVTATGNINDNPWLDEADRVGRVKNVTDMATADIKNYQTEYANKLKEVQDLVTRETADNTQNTTANKAKLAALESQAKALATQAATNTKTANTPPKTITGSKTGTTYQWNATTQTFDPIIQPSGGGTPSTADAISGMEGEIQGLLSSNKSDGTPYSIDGYISPQDWNTALKAWNTQGLSTTSFISNFKQYANPNDTYTGVTKSKSSTSATSSSTPAIIPGISLAGSTQAVA